MNTQLDAVILLCPCYFLIPPLKEPNYCKFVNCTKPEAVKVCPLTCAPEPTTTEPPEPEWCGIADCTISGVREHCKESCPSK